MADVKEMNLASKSSLAGTDFLRLVGSDNVSYKQLVSDVAKYIVENYTGSTVAGSPQSVKSALDALNSKLPAKMNFQVFEVDSGGKTISLSNGYRGTLFIHDSSVARNGIAMIGTTGGGVVIFRDIVNAEVTFSSPSSNKLYIVTNSGTRNVVVMTVNGTATI